MRLRQGGKLRLGQVNLLLHVDVGDDRVRISLPRRADAAHAVRSKVDTEASVAQGLKDRCADDIRSIDRQDPDRHADRHRIFIGSLASEYNLLSLQEFKLPEDTAF